MYIFMRVEVQEIMSSPSVDKQRSIIEPKLNQLCQYMQRSAALRQSGSFNASLRSPIAELDFLRDHMHARYICIIFIYSKGTL